MKSKVEINLRTVKKLFGEDLINFYKGPEKVKTNFRKCHVSMIHKLRDMSDSYYKKDCFKSGFLSTRDAKRSEDVFMKLKVQGYYVILNIYNGQRDDNTIFWKIDVLWSKFKYKHPEAATILKRRGFVLLLRKGYLRVKFYIKDGKNYGTLWRLFEPSERILNRLQNFYY